MEIADIITYVIGIVIAAGGVALAKYVYFKRKLHVIRELIDELDNALYDDKITEEEYRQLWQRFKALIEA